MQGSLRLRAAFLRVFWPGAGRLSMPGLANHVDTM
jgi:hypothetical protein